MFRLRSDSSWPFQEQGSTQDIKLTRLPMPDRGRLFRFTCFRCRKQIDGKQIEGEAKFMVGAFSHGTFSHKAYRAPIENGSEACLEPFEK